MTEKPAEIPELPSEQAIDRLVALLEPYRRITRPKFYGIDNLFDEGALLVGNHTIYGFLDQEGHGLPSAADSPWPPADPHPPP